MAEAVGHLQVLVRLNVSLLQQDNADVSKRTTLQAMSGDDKRGNERMASHLEILPWETNYMLGFCKDEHI